MSKHLILLIAASAWLSWLHISPLLSSLSASKKDAARQASASSKAPSQVLQSATIASPTPSNITPSSVATANEATAARGNPNRPPSYKVSAKLQVNPDRLEISLRQRQVSLYQANVRVRTYPIAVGKAGWETPTGTFKVLHTLENPTWINPITDRKILGGDPKNPLGAYWIAFWTDGRNWVGFHGTPDAKSVGQAASHGCLRMRNEDIQELFYQVSLGMPVIVRS
jgi:lipoprotein-anchoring transpeptidase ErfK/SrfK